MADRQIKDLDEQTTIDLADLFLLQDGASDDPKRVLAATLFNFVLSNVPAFGSLRGSSQALSASTWTKLQANTETYDFGNNYDNATNYRFTVPVGGAGVYHFSGNATHSASERMISALRINGVDDGLYRGVDISTDTASGARTTVAVEDVLLDEGDYVEMWVWSDDAVNTTGRFSGHLVRLVPA